MRASAYLESTGTHPAPVSLPHFVRQHSLREQSVLANRGPIWETHAETKTAVRYEFYDFVFPTVHLALG